MTTASGGSNQVGGTLTTGGDQLSGGNDQAGGISNAGGSDSSGGTSQAGGSDRINDAGVTGGFTDRNDGSMTGGIDQTGGIAVTGGIDVTGGITTTGGIVGFDSGIPIASLLHRYSFTDTNSGGFVPDLVGSADATLVGGATLNGSGQVVLDGSTGYIELPAGMISTLKSATFVMWMSWNGGNCGQRIFDFGTGTTGGSSTYFNLATGSCSLANQGIDRPIIRFVTGSANSQFEGLEALTAGEYFIAVVVDADAGTLSWYINTQTIVSTSAPEVVLASLDDSSNWLGKSSRSGQPLLSGSYDEFRIYNEALSAQQIKVILDAGPELLP